MAATDVFPDEEATLEACGKLIDLGAWDPKKIDPTGWLSNFDGSDKRFALLLLSRFTYLSDHLVDQLFSAAFQNLSNFLWDDWAKFDYSRNRWRAFCDQAIITLVQGENPNPSDSGWLFARKARQTIGLDQEQLFPPEDALVRLAKGHSNAVVFVDDFVGSGEQFLTTWHRKIKIDGDWVSFESIAKASKAQFYYCNAMSTEYGLERLRTGAPTVKVSCGNVIPKRYSLVHNQSLLWPPDMCKDGIGWIKEVSKNLGYVSEDGSENDWRGFHKLGLALAFEHSVPDANLPIFFSQERSWKALVKRT